VRLAGMPQAALCPSDEGPGVCFQADTPATLNWPCGWIARQEQVISPPISQRNIDDITV
jgi:hypothetical protein